LKGRKLERPDLTLSPEGEGIIEVWSNHPLEGEEIFKLPLMPLNGEG